MPRRGKVSVRQLALSLGREVHGDETAAGAGGGDEIRGFSANEYLEGEMQKFLDEKAKIQIKHVQFTTADIIPKTASWSAAHVDIDWEMEKSVLILCEEQF